MCLIGWVQTQNQPSDYTVLGDGDVICLTFDQNEATVTWEGHLTHWGRVTHIFVSKLTIICPDNGLSPGDDAKPLPEPMLEYCWLDPWEQTSMKS